MLQVGKNDADLKSITSKFQAWSSDSFYSNLLSSDLWPVGVNVRPFLFYKRCETTTSAVANVVNSSQRRHLNIYFQNASGLRTKSCVVKRFSSQLDFDVFVIVETWLNNDFLTQNF